MQKLWVQSLGQEDPLEGEYWQPTPVFLPGKSHGQRSLAGYSPQGHSVGQDLVTKSTNNNHALSVYALVCQRDGEKVALGGDGVREV